MTTEKFDIAADLLEEINNLQYYLNNPLRNREFNIELRGLHPYLNEDPFITEKLEEIKQYVGTGLQNRLVELKKKFESL